MRRSVLTLFLTLLAFSACAHDSESRNDTINVLGVGEVEAEPDQATLQVSITAQKPTLAAAKNEADERYRRVLEVIEKAGIDKKHVRGTQLSAQPQYDYRDGERVYRGELVSRSLAITLNDLSRVSSLIDALVQQGVSSIEGLQTGFQDRAGLQQQALGKAADDAHSKAKFLAERLGRSLGAAVLIQENQPHAQPVYHREVAMKTSAMASNTAPPEMFGTVKVEAQVSVSFNLL